MESQNVMEPGRERKKNKIINIENNLQEPREHSSEGRREAYFKHSHMPQCRAAESTLSSNASGRPVYCTAH
jgi:hypothetical protein